MAPTKKNAKRKRQHQASLEDVGNFPLLKKPHEVIGKEFTVPGSHWGTSAGRGEANKEYVCIIQDFSLLHTFSPTERSGAMQILEVGESGSAGRSESFWMPYPFPFLKFWYKSHPELLKPVAHHSAGGDARGPVDVDEEQPSGKAAETPAAVDVENEVYKYLDIVRSFKITEGKQKGRMCHKYKCNIVSVPGGPKCGGNVTIYGKSTGVFFKHVRRKAGNSRDVGHKKAAEVLNMQSCRQVQLPDGTWATVFTFKECFPHHVDFVWLVASGLPMRLNRNVSMRDFVRGFQPRAVLPHNETVHRIASAIDEVQLAHQHAARQAHIQQNKGFPCIGLQLDMWTDRNSGVAYVCINDTWIRETENKGLRVVNEVLDFHVFPFTSHTAENISTWLVGVLARHEIPADAISGVTPDGASDGQAGCRSVAALQYKTDVCHLHDLMRVVLYGIGLAGTKSNCANTDARDLVKVNKRFVQLVHQSRDVSDDLRKQQAAAKIPAHKYLRPVRTNATRWLNKAKQVSRNNLMRPIIDAVLTNFRRDNVNECAMLERDSSSDDSDGEVPRGPYAPPSKAVTRRDIAFTSSHWDANLELEGLMQPASLVKETIEHTWWLNGAQSTFLMMRLTKVMEKDKPLTIQLFPNTAKLEDRKRTVTEVSARNVLPLVVKGREEMIKQIKKRFLDASNRRPSESRLVQLHMSLQLRTAMADMLPDAWRDEAKAFYLRWLRKIHEKRSCFAHRSASTPTRRSPRQHPAGSADKGAGRKKAKATSMAMLMSSEDDEEDGPRDDGDEVMNEVAKWESLKREDWKPFVDKKTGLINEYEFIHARHRDFPLHYSLFIQVMSHISIEANSENTFSLSGKLSNPNTKTAPDFLGTLVRVQANKTVYKPTWKQIFTAYEDKWGTPNMGEDVDALSCASSDADDDLSEASEDD